MRRPINDRPRIQANWTSEPACFKIGMVPGGLLGAWSLGNSREVSRSRQFIRFNSIRSPVIPSPMPDQPSSTADLTEQLAQARRQIDAALDRYTDFSADCPSRLREAIRYSLLAPGKRLRPM